MDDRAKGLYNKYKVVRLGETVREHKDCQYFVLDISHDPHALPAIRAYADSCEKDGYVELANDLRRAYNFHQPDGSDGIIWGSGRQGKPEDRALGGQTVEDE